MAMSPKNGSVNRIAKAEPPTSEDRQVTISAPNLQTAEIRIWGTAPYVQEKFDHKVRQKIHATQAAGSTSKKGSKREPKDFMAAYEGAMHRGPKGEHGIPATAFRNAMISACRLAGFHMTKAKLSVFVLADFYDRDEGTPLIAIDGLPEYSEMAVRNDSGVVDLRARPMWREWGATVRVQFDADQFTLRDVCNLMARVGMQVGIGAGRPDSKSSAGMGWGLFSLEGQ